MTGFFPRGAATGVGLRARGPAAVFRAVRSLSLGLAATVFAAASAHATLVVSQSVSSNTIVVGDISTWANTAGGGISFARGLFSPVPSSTIDVGNHTLTLDPVNAVNAVRGTNAGIVGTGNVVKTGAGSSTRNTSASSVASWLECTGFITDIREGAFAITGIASLHNSSRVSVNATLDISGTASGTNINNTANTPDFDGPVWAPRRVSRV